MRRVSFRVGKQTAAPTPTALTKAATSSISRPAADAPTPVRVPASFVSAGVGVANKNSSVLVRDVDMKKLASKAAHHPVAALVEHQGRKAERQGRASRSDASHIERQRAGFKTKIKKLKTMLCSLKEILSKSAQMCDEMSELIGTMNGMDDEETDESKGELVSSPPPVWKNKSKSKDPCCPL